MDFLDLNEATAQFTASGSRSLILSVEGAAGQEISMASSVIKASLVAQAGARIIVIADRPPLTKEGSDILMLYKEAGKFTISEAATMVVVDDDPEEAAEVAQSSLPIFSSNIEWSDADNIAVRFKVTRRQQKDVGGDTLPGLIMQSIVAGLARAADKMLLTHIIAQTPEAFTLSKAATRGLEFAELRAFIGTAGSGAAVGQDGTLRASGVLAELTPTVSATVIGAFNRSAVAIHPALRVVAERLNINGDLDVSCWASMVPLVPDPTAFWTVS